MISRVIQKRGSSNLSISCIVHSLSPRFNGDEDGMRTHAGRSDLIHIGGIARWAVSYKDRTVTVEFHILPWSCGPILAGVKALRLKIISFDRDDQHFNPVLMVDLETSKTKGESSFRIQETLAPFHRNFKGTGLPTAAQARTVPYHLQSDEAIKKLKK